MASSLANERPVRPVRQPSMIRSALEYSIGGGLGLIGSIVRVVMVGRILSADERGLWLGLQLALSYATNLHLGACDGMFRAIPMLRAKGDDAGAESAKGTTLTFVLGMSVVGWLALAVFVALHVVAVPSRYLLLLGVLTTVTLLRAYYTSLFKGESRFRDLSVSATIGGVSAILTVGLLWADGLVGLMWGMIIQAIAEVSWLAGRDGRPSVGLSLPMLRELLGVGVMVLGTTLLSVFATSVDRTVMLSRFGVEQAGLYYVGANIIILLPVVSGLPFTVLTPKFFEVYGATGRGDSLVELLARPVRESSVVFAAILGAGALAIPAVVARVWPALMPGNDAARIAALATFPLVMFGLVARVFYAMNKLLIELVILGLGGGVGFLCAHVAVRIWPTLAAAASGAVVGLFVTYFLSGIAAYKLMVDDWRPGVGLVLRSVIPAAVAVALVSACDALGGRFWPASSVLRTVLSELVFCAVFAPAVVRAARRLRPSAAA